MDYRTIKAFPTIEVSKGGNFRHKAVRGFKGTDVVDIQPLDIKITKSWNGFLQVMLPKINKEQIFKFAEEDATKHFVDTWIGMGIAKRRVKFINGRTSDLSLDNIKIID